MGKTDRFAVGLLAVVFAGAVTATPAEAQEKKAQTKVLFDNETVRVQEVTFAPGAEGANTKRPSRVMRVLEGGTIRRTYANGKAENVVYRTGEVKLVEAERPFVPRNIGDSDIVFLVVSFKGQKR